ncbi:MAG TPA: pyridoxal-phosphate dependent enzyme [Cytophagaceae bacterium]|jgi:1-aminocyclopropane-1-carboxylate deaminase
MIPPGKSILTKLDNDFVKKHKVNLYLKREDLLHPTISGNKWRKLKYNLIEAHAQDKNALITLGGAFSNHVYAVAAAGELYNFQTIALIRGEATLPLNPTLDFAVQKGMKLIYIPRDKYKDKESLYIDIEKSYSSFYLIPEGGTNSLAVKGCTEIVGEIDIDFDYICCACGTGGTLAGIIQGLQGEKKALGFSALRGEGILEEDVEMLVGDKDKFRSNWTINYNYHFGGYAKLDKQLVDFIDKFERDNAVTLEPIYTGKMMFGIYDLIEKGQFKAGETVVALHTGGLQGLQGLAPQMQKLRTEN